MKKVAAIPLPQDAANERGPGAIRADRVRAGDPLAPETTERFAPFPFHAMKNYLRLLPLVLLPPLLLACAKKQDAAPAPDPDAVPAGQHLLKAVFTGGDWGSGSPQPYPQLYLRQGTGNTAGKIVYPAVKADWQENPDAKTGHTLRLAYRDTAFGLVFYPGVRVFACNRLQPAPPPVPGAMNCRIYVDGRDQGTYAVVYNQCDGQEWAVDTKNLK